MRSGYDPTRSKKYSAVKTRIFSLGLVFTIIALAVFQLFLSRPVAMVALGVHPNFYIACFIFAGAFFLFMYVAGFPIHLVSSFFVERHFGLSRQTFSAWLVDEVKSTVLSFGLSIICVQVFYLVLRNFPAAWWMILGVAWIFFSIVLTRFLPVLLIPIFFKYLPIEDDMLKTKIIALAEKAGIRLMDVCRIDLSRKTAKANAALVGLGKTRKVILADTLTDGFTPSEITVVIAHEFGHFKYKHMHKLLAFSGGMTMIGFFVLSLIAGRIVAFTGASGITDLYLFPILVFLLFASGIILLPVQNLFSRILERQADRYALDLTGAPEEFISVMEKLAEMNLADTEPSKMKKVFLYDHPPISERIGMAQRYERSHEDQKDLWSA
jgi:STE24 endopeptidase